MNNYHKLILAGALTLSGLSASAITPMWLRDVKISPDGSKIAFTYAGDIYSVPVSGGKATRLTATPGYESHPVWSPDGTQIAFASDRNGGTNVYVMPADGGAATRLTFNSASQVPQAFTPDGKEVIYTASIQDPVASAMFPSGSLAEVYKVSAEGGRPVQILGTPASNIVVLADGSMVYEDVKGMEDELRKHHTSAVTRDIWIYNPADGTHRNLTPRAGEDLSPAVTADGSTLYFLSEREGDNSLNVYSLGMKGPSVPVRVTDFKTHPLRFLSVASDGTLAYTYNGEIYTQQGAQGKPVKPVIDITADYASDPYELSFSSADESALSPDGKQIAFVKRGEVFVKSVEYPSTKQVTRTPEGESDVTWGRDSRTLYYTSERDGHYNIYKATIARADDPNFSNAVVIEETPLFDVNDNVDRTVPSISPDGKKMAFIEDRNKLMVMDLASGEVRQLASGTNPRRTKGFDSRWSPDGRYLLIEFVEPRHDPYGDIAIVEVATGKLTKITETGYFDESPRWVMDGDAILFLSERYGMRNHASWGSQYDVMLTFLTQDAYDKYSLSEEDYALLKEVKSQADDDPKSTPKDKKKKKDKKDKKDEGEAPAKPAKKYDLTNLDKRTVRLTPNSATIADAILSDDGQTLYYLAAFEDDYDLWEIDLRKQDVSIAKKLNTQGCNMELDSSGNIYLLGGNVKKYTPGSGKLKTINLSGRMDIDQAKEREYMLRHVYNEERERFFRIDMNGAQWDSLYANYRRFLPHIYNNYDFADLLSELLGELNVSHTGGSYRGAGPDKATASLGLLYDMAYEGPGLKVEEVLADGPFDFAKSRMVAGSVITAINSQPLSADADPLALLNNLRGKKTLVAFMLPDGTAVEEVVLPVSAGAQREMLYRRWVKQCQAKVDSLSDGRLGYVHIRSMSDDSFRSIYADMLGKYIDKEGIVIDTRWNGGGRLHEDIEVLFSGKKYLTQEIHGVTTSDMPSRRWNKPSVMIICEANYSNAHGTPWVYSHLGLGKLVGMPVPGTMSSVNWERLQDNSLVYGIPVTGFRTAEGTFLENSELKPDIMVANDPVLVVRGVDSQLEAAVKSLLNDIDNQ